MNRTARTALALVVALGAAAAASWAVYRAIQQMPVREVEVARTHAVVAARPVSVGTMLSSADVKLVPWPADSPVPGAFTAVADVENRGAVANLEQNEIITETKLAPREAGAGLPASIPVGMRAISVKVNEVVGVAGFVVPGTRVDLLVVVEDTSREPMARLVVGNLQVLTAGTRQDQERSKADGKPIQSTVVTLLATPADSERIALAQTEGRVLLVLRSPLDTQPLETTGVRLAALMGPPAPLPVERKAASGRRVMVAQAPPPPPAPKVYVVEAIRGAKRTEEPIR